jgi:phage terminase large subunit
MGVVGDAHHHRDHIQLSKSMTFQPLSPIDLDAEFPRPLEALFEPRRYKVLYGGRGAGRSWSVARALLILGTKRPIRVLCARELQKSIEDSVHKVLVDQISALGLDGFYEIQKKNIFGKNGTSFSFEGIKNNAKKVKSYEGLDFAWVEEAANVSRASWGVLIPTIRKPGSEIWMTFNPELEEDYTYDRFVKDPALRDTEKGPTGWLRRDAAHAIVTFMTGEDNPWFPQVLVDERERDKERDYDHYLNVWKGLCIQHLEGAVYANELRKVREEGRICSVPYERESPVDVFSDLGRADNTALWFVQRIAMQWRCLAYYEESGKDWPHFLKEIQRRQYVVGTLFLPHDGKAKRLGSRYSIEELSRQSGFKVAIVPKLSITDGINAARIVMKNCFFDEDECADGLRALRHYRYRVVDGQRTNEPMHDWSSDGADAFRYFAVSSKTPRVGTDVPSRLKRTVSKLMTAAPGLGWMG